MFSPTSLFAALPSFPSLPALPAVPLPKNVQHRLVAFLLHRALGAFVTDDRWDDEERVEADVRNGKVRVRELEVDAQAINTLLSPSSDTDEPAPPPPIELVSGRLSSVTANIGYPSLSLSAFGGDAKLDLEVDGVELVFQVRDAVDDAGADEEKDEPPHEEKRPRPGKGRQRTMSEASTSSSFSTSSTSTSTSTHTSSPSHAHPPSAHALSLSLAHSFLSSAALSPAEESQLRESLHLPPAPPSASASASIDLPGAFGGARPAGQPEQAQQEEQVEEVEAGLLATVVERILARLSVKVKRVSVRVLWEGKAGVDGRKGEYELRLEVDEVGYRGAGAAAPASEGGVTASAVGSKTLSVSPPRVYLKSPTSPAPPAASPTPSPPSSPQKAPHPALIRSPPSSDSSSSSSSEDSGDESDLLAMSQSIADLRTSTASLTLSTHSTRSRASLSASAAESSVAGSTMFRSAREFESVLEEAEEDEREQEQDPFHDPDGGGEGEEDDDAFETPQGSPVQRMSELPQRASSPSPGGAEPSTAEQSTTPHQQQPQPAEHEDKGVLILCLGSPAATAFPLVFTFSAPPPSSSSTTATTGTASTSSKPLLSANLSQGWVLALSALQVGALLDLAGRFSSASSATPELHAAGTGSSGVGALGVQVAMRLSGVDVVVAYSPTSLPVAFNDRFWSAPSSVAPDAPHVRLRLTDLGFSTSPSPSRSDVVDFSIGSLSLTETSSAKRTLPLLLSDPNLLRTVDSSTDEAEAVDWVQLAAGGAGAVESGERWTREGRFVGGKGRKSRKGRGEEKEKAPEGPAVRVCLSLSGTGGVDVQLSPSHAFLDVTVLERMQALVKALSLPPSRPSRGSASQPARTPRPLTRTPLRRDILDDLELLASPSSGTSSSGITLTCPLFRLSLRCPAPPSFAPPDNLALRSGRLLIDLSHLSLTLPSSTSASSMRATIEDLSLRFAPLSSPRARLLARVAPLVPRTHDTGAALPSLTFSPGPAPEIALSVPLVHVQMDKPLLDGVQLLADDLGQFFAASATASSGSGRGGEDESSFERGGECEKLLGSRYFAKSAGGGRRWDGGEAEMEGSAATIRGGGGGGALGREGTRTLRLGVEVTDIIVDMFIDRLPSASTKPDEPVSARRQLSAAGSDLSVSVELFTGGDDDLRARVSLMDIKVEELFSAPLGAAPHSGGSKRVLLARTLQRNLAAPTPPAPLLTLDFASHAELETSVKESRVSLGLDNLTVYLRAEDLKLFDEVSAFAKAPEGAFDNVVPTELTALRLHLSAISLHVSAPTLASQVVLTLSSFALRTDLMPDLPRTSIDAELGGGRVWAVDSETDLKDIAGAEGVGARNEGEWWKSSGFVQLVEVAKAEVGVKIGNGLVLPDLELLLSDAKVDVALCADSIASVSRFIEDLTSAEAFKAKDSKPSPPSSTRRRPARRMPADLLASVDPAAFERAPALHDMPEILDDDVPTNLDYLADALNQTSMRPKKHRQGASSISSSFSGSDGQAQGELISDVDGETIRMLSPRGIEIVDEWLAEPKVEEKNYSAPASKIRCRLVNADVAIHLHEGYDWFMTRKAIEEEAKAVRRRLEKIRQLLASGQTPDASAEKDASVLMFGSLQLGLPPGASDLAPKDLLAAINEELDDSPNSDAMSTTSSWQTFSGGGGAGSSSPARRPAPAVVGKARKKLTRSRTFAIEINLRGLTASFDSYPAAPASSLGRSMYASMLLPTSRSQLASKLAIDVSSLDIIDNIKTSTWRKFLTELRPNDGGTGRATGAPMAKVEMSTVRPVGGVKDAREEILLKIKISPLRLYIDQDALDFLKAFGAFELPPVQRTTSPLPAPSLKSEPFFQRVEVFPVRIKLDYKPKRVDYNALRNGKTAELMNFFHFDGSEMTLRHLIVTGISGATTLSTLVQDIWTPDVKAHQLADVISGIAPVRSVVNVGAGVANLVLLPIEQYRKDGRVVRGLQKGAQAFAKQTALEAINVGAKLATGTQVILEQAEHVLGAKFNATVAAEAVPSSPVSARLSAGGEGAPGEEPMSDEEREVRSRYADQPANVKQGVESAYRSLRENVKEGAQTILAVPMEVYERSANEGPVKAVVRAVPIAVLKPMIGASGAVSKALLGLRNTLDPDAQRGELEDKYKAAPGRSG
ncbi:hypothetical protein JCM6882_003464 [Rhodosporidiobolus microsporus]